jgi:hypothetical protein
MLACLVECNCRASTSMDHYRTYAVALFWVTTACFLPAAAWYVPILCV